MRLRRPVRADAQAVFELLVARDLADLGAADLTREDLDEQWLVSGFDLSADAVVCELAGILVGYAALRRKDALVAVTPAHEEMGVGTLLLQWAERRERDLGRERHRQVLAAGNASAARLLTRAGYEHVHSYRRMRRALDGLPARIEPPPGVSVRAPSLPTDAEAIYTLDARSFADSTDYVPMSFDEFREEHLRAHDFAEELSAVAERDGRLIGFLLARRLQEEGVGYVDILAIAPDSQGQGAGSTLLLDAFHRFAAAGLREAHLGVASSNPGALRLYERMGMAPRFRFDVFERPVSPT